MSTTLSRKISGSAGLILFYITLLVATTGCKKEKTSHPDPVVNSGDSPVTIKPEIIYTDVIPDSSIRGGTSAGSYDLDLNNDGSPDFSFSIRYDTFQCGNQLGKDILVRVSPAQGNEIASDNSFPDEMDTFQIISSSQVTWSAASNQVLIHNRAFYGVIVPPAPPGKPNPPLPPHRRQMPFDNNPVVIITGDSSNPVAVITDDTGDGCAIYNIGGWLDFYNAYVGLKLMAGGHTYYGWVQLSLDFESGSFTVYDYAYNRVPEQPIQVGQVR